LSNSHETRAANAALLGYHYQLDKALLEILNCKTANALVTVEGVEDVDVNTEDIYKAIQCKYYEAQKGTPSTLREPIQLMLLEFRNNPSKKWAFHLYVHYGQSSELPALNLMTLKSILTYRKAKKVCRFHEDNNLTDEALGEFLKHFTITIGPSHEDQQKQVFRAIATQFNSTATEAANFLYPKGLAVVLRIATKCSREERTVNPTDVLNEIRQASLSIISPWLIRMLGTERAYQFIQKALKGVPLFRSARARTIVIGPDEGTEPDLVQMTLADFVEKLALSSFCVGKTLCDAKPWSVIVNTTAEALTEVKRALLVRGISFNDGYEHVEFSAQLFAGEPVVNRRTVKGKATDRIGRASYTIRFASFSAVAPHLNDLPLGDVLLCVSDPDVQFRVGAACGTKVNIGGQWSRSKILTLVAR
jgi:hypothetical protein